MLSKSVFVVATVLTIGSSMPSFADSSMSAFFDNTMIMTMPDGGEVLMYIDADNTYSGVASNGSEFGGVWELRDGKACFTRQPANHAPLCEDYPGKQVGDTWEGTINAGNIIVNVELVEGR